MNRRERTDVQEVAGYKVNKTVEIHQEAPTSNDVPQVDSFVPLDALVGNSTCVVDTERQTDQGEANGHKQEENHHHVKATV